MVTPLTIFPLNTQLSVTPATVQVFNSNRITGFYWCKHYSLLLKSTKDLRTHLLTFLYLLTWEMRR